MQRASFPSASLIIPRHVCGTPANLSAGSVVGDSRQSPPSSPVAPTRASSPDLDFGRLDLDYDAETNAGDASDATTAPPLLVSPANLRKRSVSDAELDGVVSDAELDGVDVKADTGHIDELDPRTVARRALREAACVADAERVQAHRAARLRGGIWTPECHRNGDRAPNGANVVVTSRVVEGGMPMISGPDGLMPNPAASQESGEGYAPGIGTRHAGEMLSIGDEDEGESEVEDKEEIGLMKGKKAPKGWKQQVHKTTVKKATVPLISSLSLMGSSRAEDALQRLVRRLVSPVASVQPDSVSPSWVLGASSSLAAIASIVTRIKALGDEARVLEFHRLVNIMQLSILVN